MPLKWAAHKPATETDPEANGPDLRLCKPACFAGRPGARARCARRPGGERMLFLARLSGHVCINDVTISPTWNRGYVAQARSIPE